MAVISTVIVATSAIFISGWLTFGIVSIFDDNNNKNNINNNGGNK